MKRSVFLSFVITLTLLSSLYGFQEVSPEKTTILLVRHAEKEGAGRDPVLSKKGSERADNLRKKLSGYSIKEIYSTPFKRTLNTAKPTADALGIEIKEYMPQKDMSQFLDSIIEENRGHTVLIVGHSNTTPILVNQLIGEDKLTALNEDDYGDLFIVTVSKTGEGKLELDKF